ncbi:exodeoxyribonuclease V subunit alpha [Methyloterricola oryzae]|uniref:exodeoxyribonuclease V subunit alpha n=1 Tax=Methyloterricola oryzae TaxID=1495050 RepID=UPI0005EBA4C5|nr:exodeoxyribonuclease V subunit alpha [Methyloterricola oryzae]
MNPLDTPEESLADGFARRMLGLSQALDEPARDLLFRAARAVSLATSAGHVCVDLREALQLGPQDDVSAACAQLQATGLVTLSDSPSLLPLVIDSANRLYLARYFDYERRLAAALLARTGPLAAEPQPEDRALLDRLFSANRARLEERADWQKLGCAMALCNRLTIVAGGPGTGKTTTLVSLLAVLLRAQPQLRVALAAPTGKAAQRMREAMQQRAAALPEDIRDRLPDKVHTVHRLLGAVPDRRRFRHHAGNPLPIDLLVVDEASMLDLALATRLLEAVPGEARVVFLGDKDQLAAVEAGAVFHEICTDPGLDDGCRERLAALTGCAVAAIRPLPPRQASPLRNCAVWLDDSLRYRQDSGIGQLAADINRGDGAAALRRLGSGAHPELEWIRDGGPRLAAVSMNALAAGFDTYREAVQAFTGDAADAFAAFDRFRVLCAVRASERGAERLNQALSARFREGLRDPRDKARNPWFPGRPLIITSNDYGLGLFNGDVGLCLPAAEGGLLAYFPEPGGGYRSLAPSRLPPHETAFAMTVHKAQGSEFAQVALVLPATSSRVLSRELLFTAVTRARRKVMLFGAAEMLAQAIATQTQRNSGLLDRLRELAPPSPVEGSRAAHDRVS